MTDFDSTTLAKFHRLEELIIDPRVRPRLPDGYFEAITGDLAKIKNEGRDPDNEDVYNSMVELVDEYEGWLIKYADEPQIYSAVRSGDLAKCVANLSTGFEIDRTDADGMTLLMIAATKGHAELVSFLIQHGAKVATTCEEQNGFDAFMMACANGHALVAGLILDQGVDVNMRYAPGSSRGAVGNQTALSFAANRGRLDVCRLLISRGAELDVVAESGYTPLMSALVNGASEEAATLLLDAGADPDPATKPVERFAGALTAPLILAASNGMARIARRLIDAKVNLDAQDYSGWTALKHAAGRGEDEVVKALLIAGADINLADEEGWTPLIGAASKAAWSTVELLIDSGANVNIATESGSTALAQVVSRRLLRHTRVSLSQFAGREVDSELEEGYAFALVFVEKLLDAGADPDVLYEEDSDNKLIDEAKENGDDDLVELLARFGGELAEKDGAIDDDEPTDLQFLLDNLRGVLNGLTETIGEVSESDGERSPGDRLIIAVSNRDWDTISELLQSDVDINHVDSDGDTALSLCVLKLCTDELDFQESRDFLEIIDALLEHGAQVDVAGCRIAPLPMVARAGHLALTSAFLRAGADADAVLTEIDADAGKTALEVARDAEHEDIVRVLSHAAQGD